MVYTLQTTTSMRKWWVSFGFRGTELLVEPKSVFKSLRNSSFVQNWERLKKLHGLQTKHATMHDSRKATKYDKIIHIYIYMYNFLQGCWVRCLCFHELWLKLLAILRLGVAGGTWDWTSPKRSEASEAQISVIWVCLKIVYPYTQWLMIIIPTKWL